MHCRSHFTNDNGSIKLFNESGNTAKTYTNISCNSKLLLSYMFPCLIFSLFLVHLSVDPQCICDRTNFEIWFNSVALLYKQYPFNIDKKSVEWFFNGGFWQMKLFHTLFSFQNNQNEQLLNVMCFVLHDENCWRNVHSIRIISVFIVYFIVIWQGDGYCSVSRIIR